MAGGRGVGEAAPGSPRGALRAGDPRLVAAQYRRGVRTDCGHERAGQLLQRQHRQAPNIRATIGVFSL